MRRPSETKPTKPAPTAAEAPKAPPKKRRDPVFPEPLCDFMLTGWQRRSKRLPPKVPGAKYFAARRQKVGEAFVGDVLVIPTGHEKVRANDTNYPFRPGSDFYYLTGNLEPDCVLILKPLRTAEGADEATPGAAKKARRASSPSHEAILFVEPNPGRSDTTFFSDRVKGELWVGPRLGIPESAHRFGIPACRPLKELKRTLEELAAAGTVRVVRDIDPLIDAALPQGPDEKPLDAALMAMLSEMRLIKDAHEIKALKAACDSTRRGFEDVIARLSFAKSEREVEGVFNLRARMEGNAVGYNTIAASGQHAGVLHWDKNHGELTRKDLLLLDAGVEGNELYTADVTRTLPISGRFSPAQRKVYELVLEAQREAFLEVKPGRDFMAANTRAMQVLTRGLVRMGILKDYDDAMDPEHQWYRRYTLHNVSHMLGIDVHDCAQARAQAYRFGKLAPGMVLTVEPGLYFQHDDLTVPKELRGIGVRIEDDVVVTAKGHKILSDLPRETREVEAWMKDVWKRKRRS